MPSKVRARGGRTDECVEAELVPEVGKFVQIVDGADGAEEACFVVSVSDE